MTARRRLIREILLALLVEPVMELDRSLEDLLDAGEPLRIALIVEGAFSVLGGCEEISQVIAIIMLILRVVRRGAEEGRVARTGSSSSSYILNAALAASRRVPGLVGGVR